MRIVERNKMWWQIFRKRYHEFLEGINAASLAESSALRGGELGEKGKGASPMRND